MAVAGMTIGTRMQPDATTITPTSKIIVADSGVIIVPLQLAEGRLTFAAIMATNRRSERALSVKSVSAREAKYNFGKLIDTARAEPVVIEKHGALSSLSSQSRSSSV